MNFQPFVRSAIRAIPQVTGLLVALLGLAVLLGWQFHSTFWIQVRPWLAPMRPITALGFLLCGVGLIALQRGQRRTPMAVSVAILAITGSALWQFVLDVDLRMPPNTAIAFALAASSMLIVRRSAISGAVLGVGVSTLGVVALLGYATDVTQAFGWGDFTRMSIHSALGFAIFGLGLLAFAFERETHQRSGRSWWRSILIGASAAVAGVLFWEALRAQERDLIRRMVDATAQGVQGEMVTTSSSIVIALARLAEHGKNFGWDSPEAWQKDARLTVGAFRGFEMIEWIDAQFVPRIVASTRETPRALALVEESALLRQESLERVRTSDLPVIVGPFPFQNGGTAFRVIIPLRSPGHPEAYLSGVFSAADALATLSQHLTYGYSIAVSCQGREVFRDGQIVDAAQRWTRHMPIELPGPIPWEIAISPSPDLLTALATSLPEMALGSSLIIALLLTLTVRFGDMATMRARHLGEAVQERTRELEESMANLQSEVGERRRTEAVLRRTQILGRMVSAELDLDKVVQAVTDAATELTGAEFGSLFYTVKGENDGMKMRQAVSGSPREAVFSFGAAMGATLKAPTFPRSGVIRLDNAWRDTHRGNGADMLSGIPVEVVSYLAVPVVSRSGRVWGGLVFGHSDEGVFTERDEEIAVSLAAQAAIAMDNASLYEAELRASAQAKATNEAKDNFIHMLGHELRNPVGSIRTALQVLLAAASKKEHEADESRMRAIIERQVDQLARLVDDLLEVSQLSSAKLTLRPQPIDLADLVAESVESMRARFTTAQLALTCEVPDEPVPVYADPHRIRQILANLLANARKFTDAGGRVDVLLSVDGDDAIVSIADTGGGIDPADLERVFEPFVQTSLARDRMTGGLGLGLPIVKGLIEAQGGRVQVSSAGRDRGSNFVVRLPKHGSSLPTKEPEEQFDTPAPRRILVIDDHFDSADALKRLLDLSGNDVQVAYDGVKGIELAHTFRPDILICDIGLPGMDGFEVARRLGNDPDTESIRLIALTGFGDQNTIRAAREAGFAYHLTKPVETDVLRRILAEV